MKLIVGLGNPDKIYEKTRHNVGFMAIDFYSSNKKLDFKSKFNGLFACFNNLNDKVIVLKPQSYMNNSGDVVKKFVDYYKIETKDILVIYDDVDFEVGSFKIKKSGSSGGHNGINDIINKLKTDNINRIRIGIGKNNYELVDYVLGKLSSEDENKLYDLFPKISEIIDKFLVEDIDKIMSIYNRKD